MSKKIILPSDYYDLIEPLMEKGKEYFVVAFKEDDALCLRLQEVYGVTRPAKGVNKDK